MHRFNEGDRVQTRVEQVDHDENDVRRVTPAGTLGMVEHRITYGHVPPGAQDGVCAEYHVRFDNGAWLVFHEGPAVNDVDELEAASAS